MSGRTKWSGHARSFIAARSLRQLVLGAGALVLLASGAFGGLARVEPDDVETLTAGRAVKTEPFDIAVTKVGWTKDLGETLGESKVGRFLVVYATIRSTETKSVDGFVMDEAVRLRGLKNFNVGQFGAVKLVSSEKADPRLVVRDDRVAISVLNPGLTYDVAYIWEQAGASPLPTTVNLTVYGHSFRQSSLDDQENWFDSFPMASGTFPVTELKP